MTEGGPITATTTLAISIYRTAFQAFDMGMGAAIDRTIWLVVMLIFQRGLRARHRRYHQTGVMIMLTVHQKRWLTKFFSYLYLVAILIFTFLPILWMISSAFKPIEDLFIMPPQWIPKNPTLSTMNSVIFGDYGRGSLFPVYFKNSLIVTIGTTLLCLVVATLAAYAFSRYPFRGQ